MAKNSILDYSTTPDSNTDIGGINIQGTAAVNNFDNAFRTIMAQLADWTDAGTIASGSTTDLSTVKGEYLTVSGNSVITALGTAKAGWTKRIRFTGTPTLTHNATSLILPSSADIVVAAGDTAVFVSEGSGNWRCTEYFSSFAKTILDDATGAAAWATMGATSWGSGNNRGIKLPDGTIFQWGKVTATGGNAGATFPQAFPNACYVVVASNATEGLDGVTTYTGWADVWNLTGFAARGRFTNSGGTGAAGIDVAYFAVGR